MLLDPTWYDLNLWIHLVAASLWLGQTVNFSTMTVPILRDLPDDVAEQQLTEIGHRARRFVVLLMVVILTTGTVNLYRLGLLTRLEPWGSTFGVTAGVKVGLALLLFLGFPFLFVLIHRYGSDDLESRITRMNVLHWGISAVTVVIMFLGILISG